MSSNIDSTKPTAGSALTSDVRGNFSSAKTEINELHRATIDCVTSTGTANALIADFTNDVTLVEGTVICVKANAANTSATPTLNVDGTGAKTIVKDNNAPLAAGDISGSGKYCEFRYDATNTVWVLMNPSASGSWPVGSVYINAASSTNPATLLGFGTWTSIGAGRVLVGLDSGDTDFDTVGETGGSKDAINVSHTHTFTTSASGSHTHQYIAKTASEGSTQSSGGDGPFITKSSGTSGNIINSGTTAITPLNTNGDCIGGSGTHTHTGTTSSSGSSGVGANVQPYLVVYMWKRTA